jgi:magnesium transporter
MKTVRHSYKNKFGKPPGTIEYTGSHKSVPVTLNLFQYDASGVQVSTIHSISEFDALFDPQKDHWVQVIGLHDAEVIRQVGNQFQISDLILEDIANVRHNPKKEINNDYILFITKVFRFDEQDNLKSENISFVLKENVLITFQEFSYNLFDAIQDRIKAPKSRLLSNGVDYLLFALLDLIIDHQIVMIDSYSEDIDTLEEKASSDYKGNIVETINQYKRELILMHRYLAPLKDMTHYEVIDQSNLIQQKNLPFFKDLSGMIHANVGQLEFLRDTLKDLVEIHSSLMDHRMNRTIYTLTLISAIFIPLTFIAGLYGMNFDYMPELHYHNAYFIVLAVMGVVSVGMILYMKRKKWF